MPWNWQQPDWPHFTWNASRLEKAEQHFLLETGLFTGTLKHLDESGREQIKVEAMSTEALTTSEIEGEILDRASVQSSIQRHLGLASDRRRVRPAEEGISSMTVAAYRSFPEPLTEEMLLSWHKMLFSGAGHLTDIGRYRTNPEPMEVVSGPMHAPRVHFEAPPSERLPLEMARFIDWFGKTSSRGDAPVPALTRAGIAHLYFESIHPFEDGNGRIGRAIADKALAEGFGHPPLIALAATILSRQKAYYAALERANKNNEITEWLAWFAGVVLEARRRTTARVDFMIDKTRLLDRLRGQINERQEKAILRITREGPEGFKGGLSAGNYATITGASTATATRDLADLVERQLLIRIGERKHTRYHLAIPQRKIDAVTLDRRGNILTSAKALAESQ